MANGSEGKNESAMQYFLKSDDIGHGKVYKSAKYFTVRVFDSNYDASVESSDSDISLGEWPTEGNRPADPFMNDEIKWAMDLATRQKEPKCAPMKKKRHSITPAKVVKVVNDTVRGLVKPNSQLESKILQKLDGFLAETSIASEAEKTESGLLAAIRERISKMKFLCTAGKNCLETVGEIFQLLDDRWHNTGRTGVPRSARFLNETGVYISEGRNLLDDLRGLAIKGEEALVEILAARKERAIYPLKPPPSKIPTQRSRIPVPTTPKENQVSKEYPWSPIGTPQTCEIQSQSVCSSVVYQDSLSNLPLPISRTRITIRKAASEPQSKPKTQAASASRAQQRNSPQTFADHPQRTSIKTMRKVKEHHTRLDQVHARANNLISFTQGTLDLLDRRYKSKK
ncbi:Hypothetical predicted protein [Cloeon dipterum]|uniref:Uncharacterized protein n=1 Tax=Cloeon dipterum TaxID=197152 RepID=A0A8S1D713_9INSE|nr:Hypothetical predicted protein [Cloeon dipterum]